MAQLNFNPSTVAPSTGQMDPVPAGWYKAMIDESELKPTKDGAGTYLQLRFKIIEGKFTNRVLFARLNIQNASQVAQDIAYGDLSAICHAVGELGMVQDSQQLHGRPLALRVKVRPASGDYEASNDITTYKNVNEIPNTPSDGMDAGFAGQQAPQGMPQGFGTQAPQNAPQQAPQGFGTQAQPQGQPQQQQAQPWQEQQAQQPAQQQYAPQGDPNAWQNQTVGQPAQQQAPVQQAQPAVEQPQTWQAPQGAQQPWHDAQGQQAPQGMPQGQPAQQSQPQQQVQQAQPQGQPQQQAPQGQPAQQGGGTPPWHQ